MSTLRLSLALLALALAVAVAPGQAAAAERTGRLLVMLDEPHDRSAAAARAAARVVALPGTRRDGAQVPRIGLVTVRPAGDVALSALARTLRRLPGVRSVEVERRHELRFMPNDPALTAPEVSPGTPAGTPLSWWVGRTELPAAWDVARGDGAVVAVIDTGVDGGHPDIGGKIVDGIDNDDIPSHGGAMSDENGHGTHVASLACGAGDNGVGIVGAGLNCRLLVIKTDLSDGSVARSIVQAADRGADAVNMSFGSDGRDAPSRAIVEAIDYAVGKDVVLVAAAADSPTEQQGDPGNLLQPTGSGGDITAGRGLTVTASNFAGARAAFAGRGSQISLAAPGSFDDRIGPSGIFAAFPANPTELESGGGLLFPTPGCRCRATFNGDSRFAYLEGTSMAAPIVAGIAAIVRRANPAAGAKDVIRVLKQTAARPAGSGWSPELGWGVVNAAAAVDAVRAIDRTPPQSKLTGRTRVRRARTFTLKWSAEDPAPAGLAPSGIDVYEVYRSANRRPYRRIKRTRATRLKTKVKPGSRYRYYTIAIDKAGNREAVPPRPDLSTRVDPRRTARARSR
ncbi:MAG TPA: S8 family serine peptidase [Solirubrobacteraceae bacterium]|nr:S8 family serine peptidase [Solirubrobacteraceae bacterium]